MSPSRFTSGQRRVVITLAITVVLVFAILAGFIVTYLQGLENRPPIETPAVAAPVPTATHTTSPTAPAELEEGILPQVQAARLFEQIAHQAETLRGLSPRAEVPLSFLDRREMTLLLHRLYVQRDPVAQVSPYTLLGLVPEAPITIRPGPVTSIYVPEQQQLYIATSSQQSEPDRQALMARAYTHALQDQQFDLSALDMRATTTDATLAVRALVEGDALLLAALYRYEDLAQADWAHLTELIQSEQPGFGDVLDQDGAWGRIQSFPFQEGRLFTAALLQAGGWEAVNQAYTDPPRSTEQVLHPGRYLEARRTPSRVVVPDLSDALGDGWARQVQDTLGEYVVGLYLESLLTEDSAWQAAEGWDGDTFVAWEHRDGRQVVVWRTIWQDTAEATEFEYALATLIPERYLPAWPLDPPFAAAGQRWETNDGAIYLCRIARYVTFVRAPDAGTLLDVVETLP